MDDPAQRLPPLVMTGPPGPQSSPASPVSGGRRLRGHAATRQRERPLITVVTVVFNAAPVLRQALDSVRSQSYDAIEYVVIDGGSTDGTLDLIRRHDGDIDYWISEPDRGIYDAMNKALAVARGDWLLFLGADDELLAPLESIAGEMIDADAVYYGDVEIAATGAISGGRFTRYQLMQRNICHQSIFYPRSVYRSKRYDTRVGMLADHKYNIELWGSGTRFNHLSKVISRFNDAGVSSGNQTQFEAIKLATIRSNLGPHFYALKLARTAIVRLLMGRREPA